MIDRRFIPRFVIVTTLLSLALLGVAARLVYLHLSPDDSTREDTERLRRYRKEIIASRGRIFDGSPATNILALNLAVKDICADPAAIRKGSNAVAVAAQLARVLQLDPVAVLDRLNRPDRRFAYVQRFAPEAQARRIEEMKLPGVFCQDAFIRCYPHGSFMCHVLGFSNLEGVGGAGIEQTLNSWLTGKPGMREGLVDAKQDEIYVRRIREILPEVGANVYLMVDQNVQYMVEMALKEAVEKHQAKGAWAIVQRVRTGAILGMASYPSYDLNNYRLSSENQRLNRAIGLVYEPGSAMKAVIIAAALNEGLVTPSTVFDCENGSWLHEGKVLRDFHPYGRLAVADIVRKSSNIGTAKIAVLLGDKRLESYLHAFGIGTKLGIDLPGEETGILHSSAKWSRISSSRIAIGQGVAVTALQMMGVYCAIANDGFLMRPYVMDRVQKDGGEPVFRKEPEVLGRPIREDTATVMRDLLWHVTEEGGTGRKASVPGYNVAGKTGTAQKPIGGVYSDTAYWASFVGFLPAEAPEIGIVVVVDEPQPQHIGGLVAAPVFGAMAERIVRYLDISPVSYQLAGRGGDFRPGAEGREVP